MKVISSYLDLDFSESFTLHEIGIKLTPKCRTKIRRSLESLESRAPAISSIQLKFTSKKNQVKGELSIIGVEKSFCAEAQGHDPWTIYKYLENKIDQQLIKWKKTRSLNNDFNLSISKYKGTFKGGQSL